MTCWEHIKQSYDHYIEKTENGSTKQLPIDYNDTKHLESDKNKCDEIYQYALKNIKGHRLTSPNNDNAYNNYLALKQLSCLSSEKVFEQIVEQYKILIMKSINSEKTDEAKWFLRRLKSIDTTHDLSEFHSLIAKIEQKNKHGISNNVAVSRAKQESIDAHDVREVTQDKKNMDFEWINSVCIAMKSAMTDSAKNSILQSALKEVDELTGRDLYQLFVCADLLSDSSKLIMVKSMAVKVANINHMTDGIAKKYIDQDEFKTIIEGFSSDYCKSQAAAILIPLLKK